MIEINKNLDGTLEKAIRESSKLQKNGCISKKISDKFQIAIVEVNFRIFKNRSKLLTFRYKQD